MRPLRTVVIAATAVIAPVAALAIAVGPAVAHTHPAHEEFIAPTVVKVDTWGEVKISLIEHEYLGKHIGLVNRTYRFKLNSGSGFAVDPSGAIVTSREVTEVDLRRAEIRAVNKIFRERYPHIANTLTETENKQQLRGGDPADRIPQRLQQCYSPNTSGDAGGCLIFSTRLIKVLPLVTSQEKYGNLEATVLKPRAGRPASDVVVLKVGSSSMPAASLATSVKGRPFTVLGYDKNVVPSTGQSLNKPIGHFIRDDSTELDHGRSEDDKKPFPMLVTAMANGVAGGPVVGGTPEVIGFFTHQPGGSASDLKLIGPDAIRSALTDVDIKPHTGPTDSTYAAALHSYNNKLYKLSIPNLSQTVKLYPGHALANEALAVAQRKQGTAEDLTGRAQQTPATSPRGNVLDFRRAVLPLAVAGAALIVLAVAIVLLARRRRSRAGGSVPDQPVSAPPTIVVPAQRPASSSDRPPISRSLDGTGGQTTVLKSPRPGVARTYGTPRTDPGETAAACSVCGSPTTREQTFCGQCGQRLR
jgi:hypothetical protein